MLAYMYDHWTTIEIMSICYHAQTDVLYAFLTLFIHVGLFELWTDRPQTFPIQTPPLSHAIYLYMYADMFLRPWS